MPVNKKVMKNMQEEYGKEKGKKVYYAAESKKRKEGTIDDWMKKRSKQTKGK